MIFSMLDSLIDRSLDTVLERVSKFFPLRTIENYGDVYLRRYYVLGRLVSKYYPPGTRARLGWLPFIVYLHCFERPDREREPHNHPFSKSVSLILTGGYLEERVVGEGASMVLVDRVCMPFTLNRIGQDTFHRVKTLFNPRVWTLFIAGPKTDTWYFLDLATQRTIHWREFVTKNARRDP